MFMYKHGQDVYQDSLVENKLEMIQYLAEKETQFREAKEAVKLLDGLSGTHDLNGESSVCLAVQTPEPTENTEIYDYINAGYQYDQDADNVYLVWNKHPKPLDEAIYNCKEEYFGIRTEMIRNADYTFSGGQVVVVKDFLLQAIRAQKQIENGATMVDIRLKDGTKLEIFASVFENAFNEVSESYTSECNDRDTKYDDMEASTNHEDLEAKWNLYKQDLEG
jgi:hypothetical protein